MTLTLENVQPSLLELIQTANRFSAAERLFLAKTLLDGLVIDETQKLAQLKDEPSEPSPALEEVVDKIKATPRDPRQIQRASKTIDAVMADWQAIPATEPRLTTEECEQTWWVVRQKMEQR